MYDSEEMTHPTGVRKTVPLHPAEELDLFAQSALNDTAEKLLDVAERVASAILDAQGSFTVGEVREQMGKLGLLANDGNEKLDALGCLGRRMHCVAQSVERQSATLTVSHRNRGTRWVRPVPALVPERIK